MSKSMGLLVLFVLASGCAGTQAKPKVALLETPDVPANCQPLGEVVGQDSGHMPDPESARVEAMRKADRLGATHLKSDVARTGRSGAHTETFTGQAYRCPAAQ